VFSLAIEVCSQKGLMLWFVSMSVIGTRCLCLCQSLCKFGGTCQTIYLCAEYYVCRKSCYLLPCFK
jgi:hypothetical protein